MNDKILYCVLKRASLAIGRELVSNSFSTDWKRASLAQGAGFGVSVSNHFKAVVSMIRTKLAGMTKCLKKRKKMKVRPKKTFSRSDPIFEFLDPINRKVENFSFRFLGPV